MLVFLNVKGFFWMEHHVEQNSMQIQTELEIEAYKTPLLRLNSYKVDSRKCVR